MHRFLLLMSTRLLCELAVYLKCSKKGKYSVSHIHVRSWTFSQWLHISDLVKQWCVKYGSPPPSSLIRVLWLSTFQEILHSLGGTENLAQVRRYGVAALALSLCAMLWVGIQQIRDKWWLPAVLPTGEEQAGLRNVTMKQDIPSREAPVCSG